MTASGRFFACRSGMLPFVGEAGNPRMKQVLLLKVGRTFEHIAARRGDYDAWFGAKLSAPDVSVDVVHIDRGEALPKHFEYTGLVVTGSFAMVTDREPWSEATAEYLRGAVERGITTLGVCYGHQLLAHAFGGQVENNPRGRHAGTISAQLTQAAASDRLFQGLGPHLRVQVSHLQSVTKLPSEATVLGQCEKDPHHAFRIGEKAWGVQFHPEFDGEVSRDYIAARKEIIAKEGLDPEALMAGVEDSADGAQVLERFKQLL